MMDFTCKRCDAFDAEHPDDFLDPDHHSGPCDWMAPTLMGTLAKIGVALASRSEATG